MSKFRFTDYAFPHYCGFFLTMITQQNGSGMLETAFIFTGTILKINQFETLTQLEKMRISGMGVVALAFVLINQTCGYTYSTELLRRTYAEPQFSIDKAELVNNVDIFKQKSADLFQKLDKDHNLLLDQEEILLAAKNQQEMLKKLFSEKDIDLDGLLSLNEYLLRKAPKAEDDGTAIKAVMIFLDDYGILSGVIALVILFAAIRISMDFA